MEKLAPKGLYCVATPIGHLGDISSRAIDILRRVDVIACEDTRVSAKLCQALSIETPLISYHDHNAEAQRPKLLDRLEQGQSIALISDAGTPLISDPGYKLVQAVQDAGFRVIPIPGPSAVTAALSAAGLPTNSFTFLGFLPQKAGPRKAMLEAVKAKGETLIFYESTRRLPAFLEAALHVLGDRGAAVARELTKHYEEVVRDTLSGLVTDFGSRDSIKGEVVVLIEGDQGSAKNNQDIKAIDLDIQTFYETALKSLRVKEASILAVDLFGGTRKGHYAALQSLKEGHAAGD